MVQNVSYNPCNMNNFGYSGQGVVREVPRSARFNVPPRQKPDNGNVWRTLAVGGVLVSTALLAHDAGVFKCVGDFFKKVKPTKNTKAVTSKKNVAKTDSPKKGTGKNDTTVPKPGNKMNDGFYRDKNKIFYEIKNDEIVTIITKTERISGKRRIEKYLQNENINKDTLKPINSKKEVTKADLKPTGDKKNCWYDALDILTDVAVLSA